MPSEKKDVALIVIFNHRYDKNFEAIEKLYAGRFSNIYHLVPFYNGTKENVIPVYGRSIFFQGYIAQGLNVFFNNRFKHYFFVADDMILNPAITENNYQSFFKLDDDQSFIPELIPFHTRTEFWIGTLSAYYYKLKQKYVEVTREVPSIEDAKKKLQAQGIEIAPMTRRQLFGRVTLLPKTLGEKSSTLARLYTRLRYPFKREFHLPYPLVGSYADIAIVSAVSIKDFCHYCGVFAATLLFAEVAIPSALALATDKKIVTEKDLEHQGRALWAVEGDIGYLEKNFTSLHDILTHFPTQYIYLHPVKLSKWK